MKQENRLEREWEVFRDMCFAPDSPPNVLEAYRKTFYAGAIVMKRMLFSSAVLDLSDDIAKTLIANIERECEDFKRQVLQDEAAKCRNA